MSVYVLGFSHFFVIIDNWYIDYLYILHKGVNAVNLQKEEYESDLACERRKADLTCPGIIRRESAIGGLTLESIEVTTEEGAKAIGRPIGRYDTLHGERMDLFGPEEKENATVALQKELLKMVPKAKKKTRRLLFLGLGNRELTADAVGPLCADLVTPTLHVERAETGLFASLHCDGIAVVTPGVTAKTGLDAFTVIQSVCREMEPDAVIAVDALAARSVKRLGTTLQISDTGIFPGSGVGNRKKPLTTKTLGVPVIAVGVPTVTAAKVLVREKTGEKTMTLDLSDYEGMFVSPKEIDCIVKTASEIISDAVNRTFGIEL